MSDNKQIDTSKLKAVEESLQRLRKMGLKTTLEAFNENWIAIIITSESLIDYITKVIDKEIKYPQHYVEFDKDSKLLVIHFWRGDMPSALKTKILNQWK